ncbi:unnamed protein product [Colias eurytheme]|nr:unnamed protein product [Colias eurytheme]
MARLQDRPDESETVAGRTLPPPTSSRPSDVDNPYDRLARHAIKNAGRGGWERAGGAGPAERRHWRARLAGGPGAAAGGTPQAPPPGRRPPHNARSLRAVRYRDTYPDAHRRESM